MSKFASLADGEIETRGPQVMLGYWNKPPKRARYFTDDGCSKLVISVFSMRPATDDHRSQKELLKTSGGKYVAPQPIEQLIKGSRFVKSGGRHRQRAPLSAR